jgi:hypothetical protein
MRKQKPKRTPEELSRIRSEAARKGIEKRKAVGYANVGRKKGWTKDPSLKGVQTCTMSIRKPDYDVFVRCANAADKPIVSFMHDVADSLKARNPALFAPDAQGVKL